ISLFLLSTKDAKALSQWARKYEVPCSMCHTSFPRLNHFGEKFMRNGFQWPEDEPDGDKTGKAELSEDLFIDKVGNWLGARVSFTPMNFKTNNLTVNGSLEDSFDIGNPNWLQLFVGGAIFKNVSIFIEQEFDSGSSKFSWFHLFFTNLADTYVNFQVGKLSPVDFSPFSDRLRIWQTSNILNIKSSGGSGENSVNIRQSRPGIQYYGYRGPLLWYAGIDNGVDDVDTGREKNYWGGVRLEVPDTGQSHFEGSSVGFHIYSGIDSATTSTARVENDFIRYTMAANGRYKENCDLQLTFQFGEDDNYDLATTAVKRDFQGFTITGAYWLYPWYMVLQYDQINSDDISSIEVNKISPSIWFFLRENFKAGIATRFDVSGGANEQHEAALQVRAMF
ncbi:MAG: hypothetical protein V3W26_05220, partial [Thermodesulfobacteriota bacterium]